MSEAGRWKLFLLPAVLVPIPLVLRVLAAPDLAVFAAAGVAVIPLANLMGRATEDLSKRAGPGIGGLLNATMGNATELIIALTALLRAGTLAATGLPADASAADSLVEVVKASITGAIVGNLLLVMGVSLLVGGLRYRRQTFSVKAAELQVTMLALAVAALVVPELFRLSYPAGAAQALPDVSVWIAILLLVGYILGLVFSLHTHRDVFNPVSKVEETPQWSRRFALLVLVAATSLIAIEAELLVGAIESLTQTLGLSAIFVGVIVIALFGNAAEQGTAVMMAARNKMDLSVSIATVASTQIALFVTPVLVLASLGFGKALTLAFEPFELVAIILSVALVGLIAKDGETNWFEGALLLIVYAIIGLGFFFHP